MHIHISNLNRNESFKRTWFSWKFKILPIALTTGWYHQTSKLYCKIKYLLWCENFIKRILKLLSNRFEQLFLEFWFPFYLESLSSWLGAGVAWMFSFLICYPSLWLVKVASYWLMWHSHLVTRYCTPGVASCVTIAETGYSASTPRASSAGVMWS